MSDRDKLIRRLAKTAFDRKGFPMTWESLPDDLTFQTRLNYEQALIVLNEAGLDIELILTRELNRTSQ